MALRKFSLRFLLVLTALCALLLAFASPRYRVVFEQSEPGMGRVRVVQHRSWLGRERWLKVYWKSQSLKESWDHESAPISLNRRTSGRLRLRSVVDREEASWCVFDENSVGFVLMLQRLPIVSASESGNWELWHPGIHVGWGRGMWIHRYRQLRLDFPELPYEELPSEMRLLD